MNLLGWMFNVLIGFCIIDCQNFYWVVGTGTHPLRLLQYDKYPGRMTKEKHNKPIKVSKDIWGDKSAI